MRPESKMTPRELRDRDAIGLRAAKFKIEIARLLDRIESAATTEELRECLSQFIKLTAGFV